MDAGDRAGCGVDAVHCPWPVRGHGGPDAGASCRASVVRRAVQGLGSGDWIRGASGAWPVLPPGREGGAGAEDRSSGDQVADVAPCTRPDAGRRGRPSLRGPGALRGAAGWGDRVISCVFRAVRGGDCAWIDQHGPGRYRRVRSDDPGRTWHRRPTACPCSPGALSRDLLWSAVPVRHAWRGDLLGLFPASPAGPVWHVRHQADRSRDTAIVGGADPCIGRRADAFGWPSGRQRAARDRAVGASAPVRGTVPPGGVDCGPSVDRAVPRAVPAPLQRMGGGDGDAFGRSVGGNRAWRRSGGGAVVALRAGGAGQFPGSLLQADARFALGLAGALDRCRGGAGGPDVRGRALQLRPGELFQRSVVAFRLVRRCAAVPAGDAGRHGHLQRRGVEFPGHGARPTPAAGTDPRRRSQPDRNIAAGGSGHRVDRRQAVPRRARRKRASCATPTAAAH